VIRLSARAVCFTNGSGYWNRHALNAACPSRPWIALCGGNPYSVKGSAGGYTDQDFLSAVHRGTRRDGARLYPAMPFTSYTYISDVGALAIKAYLFGLPPVRDCACKYVGISVQPALGDEHLVGAVQSGYPPRAGYFEKPGMEQGAYLAEALAHCCECHTPRNLAFVLGNRKKFAGAMTAGWRAFNIGSDKAAGVGNGTMQISFPICRSVTQTVTAPPRDRWEKRWTGASASSAGRHPRLGGLSAQRARDRVTRPAGAGVPQGRRQRPGPARQDGVRRRLRQLPRLDRREFDLTLCHSHRRVGGQRSLRHSMSPRS
jgi:mono/diheme cytochrome c family protein